MCRIRPHPTEKVFFAEMYIAADQMSTRKGWKPLLSATNEIRTFATPEESERALIEERGLFTDNRPFYIQLALGIPEEQRWRDLFLREEEQTPGSLEEMIEDVAARLVEALRELRECDSQKRANKLYEIIQGQSNRLSYLAQFINQEAKRLQWFKVDQRRNKESRGNSTDKLGGV